MTAFRRRDAVAGCIAIGLLPFFENLVTDRVLYEQVGSLAYNSSPLHFLISQSGFSRIIGFARGHSPAGFGGSNGMRTPVCVQTDSGPIGCAAE